MHRGLARTGETVRQPGAGRDGGHCGHLIPRASRPDLMSSTFFVDLMPAVSR